MPIKRKGFEDSEESKINGTNHLFSSLNEKVFNWKYLNESSLVFPAVKKLLREVCPKRKLGIQVFRENMYFPGIKSDTFWSDFI